jgi:hypothetical protein
MSMLDGEVIVCGQSAGPAVELVIYGDEFYARYETQTGYTVVYDTQLGRYSYAKLLNGAFISSGVHINKPAPLGIRRHLKENPDGSKSEISTSVCRTPAAGVPTPFARSTDLGARRRPTLWTPFDRRPRHRSHTTGEF